jgi:hypothetical protein
MEEKARKAKELQEKMAALLSRTSSQSVDSLAKSENFHVIPSSPQPPLPE